MKKILAFALALALVLTAFTGCDSENDESAEIEVIASSNDLYTAFLDDVLEADAVRDMGFLAPGKGLTLSELENAVAKDLSSQYEEVLFAPMSTDYAFIDCGADGNPELLIKIVLSPNPDSFGDYTKYLIFKDIEGQLRCIDEEFSQYRTESTINEYGLITTGGSNSAAEHCAYYYMINPDGEKIFLDSVRVIMGASKPQVDKYSVPSTLNGSLDEMEFSVNTDSPEAYTQYVYNLTEMPPYDETTYDKYLDENFFAFETIDGEPVMPSDDDMYAYGNLGIKVYSMKDAQRIVNEQRVKLGLTGKIENGGEPKFKNVADREK